MKPDKAKIDLQADNLREALKSKVRHPYITGQRLAEDAAATEEMAGNAEENPSKEEPEPLEKGD